MKKAYIVCGLAYGDEGKGTTVDFLTKQHNATLNIRYCGGHQAGHRVVLPDGRSHIFSQFGSGSFHGAETYHSRESIVEPIAMRNEFDALRNLDKCVSYPLVHEKCIITTPFHKLANRIKERANRHGSCGVGVGETRYYYIKYGNDSIFARDLNNTSVLYDKMHLMKSRYQNELFNSRESKEYHTLLNIDIADIKFGMPMSLVDDNDEESMLGYHDTVIFESTQGVLLDETYGKHPHTTWATVTPRHALELINLNSDAGNVSIEKVGVIRNHYSRHGNGPFKSYSMIKPKYDHNHFNEWQGSIQYGRFDKYLDKFKYAVDIVKPDYIFLTHMDYNAVGFKEEYITDFCPIKYISRGPTHNDKEERNAN